MKSTLAVAVYTLLFGAATSAPTGAPTRLAYDDSSAQAGIHVIYSWPGLNPPQELFDLTSEGKVGGVIIFGENVDDNLPNVISDLQTTYSESPGYCGRPLLILTDQEGGEVVRLPGGPSQSEKSIGASSDPTSEASAAGSQAASALQAYNNNGNLAPVLDVYREEGDFDDQYERSYSMDPNVVGECAAAFVDSQQGQGIVATAKHFPGLGAATADQNTDERPVTLDVSLDDLRSIDMAPYPSVIEAGISMVMPSWAMYPALDSQRPAGLSSKWIGEELRDNLGFTGVTISDAIEAGALEAFGDDPNRAVLASQAGMDLILAAARNVTQGSAIVDALAAALSDGTLSSDSFDQATGRILDLRSSL